MNEVLVFSYRFFIQFLGQRRQKKTKQQNKRKQQQQKNMWTKKCNTFKATLRSEHRCHEQRREIHTVNISNKTVEIAGILFYTFTNISVVLLSVKYVPQYIYMERYGPQELSLNMI